MSEELLFIFSQYTRVTDGQTDGRAVGQTAAGMTVSQR